MFYRIFLLQIFVLLPTCFILQKINAANFETQINENLTLIHSYPQKIISKTEKTVDALLNILLPGKNGRPKIGNWIKDNQNNTFTLNNISFFPDQKMFAVYNEGYQTIDVFSTTDNRFLHAVDLDKALEMQGFFLDCYSDNEISTEEKKMHLLIVYFTAIHNTCFLAATSFENPEAPTWRKINATKITSAKGGTLSCFTKYGSIYDNNVWEGMYYKSKEEADITKELIPKKKSQQFTNQKPILIGSVCILILLTIFWYKFL
ncbi:MAG TPA: hypothetical protein VL201_00085 [Patescibacteria group bacterium]|nr:hypothetical protein [Patescibacteria group bacterium]